MAGSGAAGFSGGQAGASGEVGEGVPVGRSNADRNRCACRIDVKRFIARSRCRVGWWEFLARLFKYFDRRWVTDGTSPPCATC